VAVRTIYILYWHYGCSYRSNAEVMSREEFADFKIKVEAARIAVSYHIILVCMMFTNIYYFCLCQFFGVNNPQTFSTE